MVGLLLLARRALGAAIGVMGHALRVVVDGKRHAATDRQHGHRKGDESNQHGPEAGHERLKARQGEASGQVTRA